MTGKLERTLVFITHSGEDKYGNIVTESGIAQYGVGELQRRSKGQGDYYVTVFDRHSQTREEVVIPFTAIECALEREKGQYSALLTRANELAPSLDIEQRSQVAFPKRNGPSILSRIWNSKPMRDLKYATVIWGTVGSAVGTIGYGGITGYRIAVSGDIEEITREVAETRFITAGRTPTDLFNFNSRIDELARAEKVLEDGVISKEDLNWKGLGDFKKGFNYGTKKFEYDKSKKPIGTKDNYFYSLCDLVSQCYNEIVEREKFIPETKYSFEKINDLINSGILAENEKKYLLEATKSLEQRKNDALANAGIRTDASCLGNEVATTVRQYREFMEEKKVNGYFDTLVNNEVRDQIRDRKISGSFIGGLFGSFAWSPLLFSVWFVNSKLEERRKKRKGQDYQI